MFYNQAETRSCDAKIRSMLNTHSISFYDPYRERNRNSALELKKTTHSKKRIALQQNSVIPHQSFVT
jgi:hypothetical protein